MSYEDELKHIEHISVNARGTWFALIAALLFSAIAVAGVNDSDFFSHDSSLTLPIINFAVPIESFFISAPVIVLGLFVYLHLYLGKLWRALDALGANPELESAIENVVFPWLVSDAAIYLRPNVSEKEYRRLTIVIVFALLWLAGPFVLLLFWWRSFTPHSVWLTLWVGLILGLGVVCAALSLLAFWKVIRKTSEETYNSQKKFVYELAVVGCLLIAVIGFLRVGGFNLNTHENCLGWIGPTVATQLPFGLPDWPVQSANLYNAEIVQRPSDWIPHHEAETRFLAQYSGKKPKDISGKESWMKTARAAFDQEQKARRDSLKSQNFECKNLQKLEAQEAFLLGAKMRKADLRGANFLSAILEGADLRQAKLQRAKLRFAKLQTAILWEADLSHACFEKADLTRADLSKSNLSFAELRKANFTQSYAAEARFDGAYLEKADLTEIVATKSNFSNAKFLKAKLLGANLSGANLSNAILLEADLFDADLTDATVKDAVFDGALVASANLETTKLTPDQLNSTFGDYGTLLPEGTAPPQHWPKKILSRASAVHQWRAWRKKQLNNSDTEDEEESNLPTKGDPLPCTWNQVQ